MITRPIALIPCIHCLSIIYALQKIYATSNFFPRSNFPSQQIDIRVSISPIDHLEAVTATTSSTYAGEIHLDRHIVIYLGAVITNRYRAASIKVLVGCCSSIAGRSSTKALVVPVFRSGTMLYLSDSYGAVNIKRNLSPPSVGWLALEFSSLGDCVALNLPATKYAALPNNATKIMTTTPYRYGRLPLDSSSFELLAIP